jgi:hypothetical protein
MNERIKELKKQAWEYTMAVHDGHIVPPLDKEVWPVDKVFDEKFAELIVRQCAEVGLDSVEDGDDLDAIMKRVHNNILTHFGVEE